MYSNGISLNAASYKTFFSNSSGSLCVPVKPSAVIYSHFDYVHGTATQHGQRGVPINRLSILNTLISQLVSMKQKPVVSESEASGLSEEQKEELIKSCQQQIKNAISSSAQGQSLYGFAGLMPEAGAVVSVSA
ncbi:hypothetical protein [Treponema sp.]|uniref:hypothetical protein n=1 Tax=Treponema sp. TaxID=166 RepID=UPI003F0ECBB0